jgi:hypothetical protein
MVNMVLDLSAEGGMARQQGAITAVTGRHMQGGGGAGWEGRIKLS